MLLRRSMSLQDFVTEEFLRELHDITTPGGIVVVNVACRSAPLFDAVLATFSKVFAAVFEIRLEEVWRWCPCARMCMFLAFV